MMPFHQAISLINSKGRMNMKEIWKDVQGYEGLYQVSNDGDVISLRFDPPKHIYQTITNSGYKQVILFKNGRK